MPGAGTASTSHPGEGFPPTARGLQAGQGARLNRQGLRRCLNTKQLVNLNGLVRYFWLRPVCKVVKARGLGRVLNQCVKSVVLLAWSFFFWVKCNLYCIKPQTFMSFGGLGCWQQDCHPGNDGSTTTAHLRPEEGNKTSQQSWSQPCACSEAASSAQVVPAGAEELVSRAL